MGADFQTSGLALTRRALVKRLIAAGCTAPVIASILDEETRAQAESTPIATPPSSQINSPFTIIQPDDDPLKSLTAIGIDKPLIPHGGFNFGTPPELVDGLVVPNDAFFIRSHGPSAVLDDNSLYRLIVNGHVENPLTLTLDDLKTMPQKTYQAFLECSGNSRGFFQPAANGGQWRNDAIGNAEWTGVPLHYVLEKACVKNRAIDVVSQGGDFAAMQRGLPIDVALAEDTILALRMNGEDLPAPHGGPVRLFVPGWGGIASTKWLIGLTVLDHAFQGEFNTESYIVVDEHDAVLRPVREMPVSSAIWSPAIGAELKAGPIPIVGYAWSGLGGISTVAISTNNGSSWDTAEITRRGVQHSWVRFEYIWDAAPGPTGLLSQATDDRGTSQPAQVPWNKFGYQYNAIQRVLVNVTE